MEFEDPEEKLMYDPQTGKYVEGLIGFKDRDRYQKESRRKRLYLSTTVTGTSGKIKSILDNLEKKIFKTASVSEIYENDIDTYLDELEQENLPNFDYVANKIVSLELKKIPFVFYTNPRLLVLAYYYKLVCNNKSCPLFMEYIMSENISIFDICRYVTYIDKIIEKKQIKANLLKVTPKVDLYLKSYLSNKSKVVISSDKKNLRNLYPDIFVKGYPRFCQYPPTVIDLKDKSKYKNYIEFPEGNYLACAHKKLPYVGMKENYLANNEEYPYLPCCFLKEQKEEKEDISTIDPYKPVSNKSIYSAKNSDRYGYLPDDLALLFKIFDTKTFTGNSIYLRKSVDKSPVSSLLCILSIFHDVDIITAKEKIKETVKTNYGSTTFINTKTIDYIIDNDEFLDAKQFIPIYEKLFKCKIVLFCLDKEDNDEGNLCSQKYRVKIFSKIDPSDEVPYIFLYESMGSIVDKYSYPQYEYIVRARTKKEKVDPTKIIEDIFIMQKDKELLTNIIKVYKDLYPIEDIEIKFKTSIIYQKYDYNGFIRMLLFKNGISCLIDPILALNIKFENLSDNYTIDPSLHTYENVHEFMMKEKLSKIETYEINNKIYGLIGYKKINSTKAVKIYFPVCDSPKNINNITRYSLNRNAICPKNLICSNTELINDEKNSYIQKYVYMSQLSRCLIAYVYYIFSYTYKLYINIDINFSDYNEIYNYMSDKFLISSEFFNSKVTLSRSLSLNSNFLRDNKVLVPSENCKSRLIYVLYTSLRQNIDYILNYSNNLYIPDFYKDIRDFSTDVNFLLLNNSSLMVFYNFQTPTYNLNYNIVDEDIFYLQNPSIEDNTKLLVVRHTTYDDAIITSYNWIKNNVNTNKNIDNYDYNSDETSIKIYIFDEDKIHIKYTKEIDKENYYILGIAKTEKDQIFYYSFLKI